MFLCHYDKTANTLPIPDSTYPPWRNTKGIAVLANPGIKKIKKLFSTQRRNTMLITIPLWIAWNG
jgi:hypothetical protein